MTRRLALLLSATGILATLFVVDRFVLNPAGDGLIAEPVTRPQVQRPIKPGTTQNSQATFLEPLKTFEEIWQRPIFTPSRKPAAKNAGPRNQSREDPSRDQPPDFKIVGVALGPKNSAVLVRENRRTIKRYYIDDRIEDWVIEEITADSITVSRDAERWLLPVGE